MYKSAEEKWVIMSKDRMLIAKGTPRDRSLVMADDPKDKKRLLTYTSKKKAESGFKNHWFWTYHLNVSVSPEDLEAVKVKITVEEIPEKGGHHPYI
jgi:hypothetical protein